MLWDYALPGKQGTPWEGGLNRGKMHFNDEYPCTPPTVKFGNGLSVPAGRGEGLAPGPHHHQYSPRRPAIVGRAQPQGSRPGRGNHLLQPEQAQLLE